jgi:hypothetical protein
MLNAPTCVIIKRYSQRGHPFFGIENYVSKNIGFHILVVEKKL